MYENIPVELKKLKQWVCYDNSKLPKNAYTGGNAMSNNPDTWSDYDTAIRAMQTYGFLGIGFMFANGYFGVDLDKCLDDVDFVDEFVDTLNSYTEISKSGNGIHIICKGSLPQGARRRGNIEMYQTGRYFIMTGKCYGEVRPIIDCTDTVKILHEKYLAERKPEINKPRFERLELSDTEIIDKARSSKNGVYFQALYDGNWQGGYSSQSEADLALCNMLAFWTQKDADQMDRIYRSSGLYRSKWDSNRAGTTYGAITIHKAISGCIEVYNPTMRGRESEVVVGAFTQTPSLPQKFYDMSDTGNAQRFTEKYRSKIRYSYINKNWFYWDGKAWCEDMTGEIKKLADEIIQDMRRQAFDMREEEQSEALLKWANKTANSKIKENMIKESQHMEGIPVLPKEFDAHDDLFNCQNGIINLRNGELMKHDSSYMLSKISICEMATNNAKPTRWLQFLEEITQGDKELEHFLQKAVGYSLTGSTKEQCVFFLYGIGCNGKSTFLDVISELAGSYSCNIQPETIMLKGGMQSSANTDIARLNGARFVTTSEPNEHMRINEGLLKQLTGGDRVTARFLYGREFEFTPTFKLWLGTNHKPIIRGTDEGIWRRVRLIPFTAQIEKVDKSLKYKLRKELPSILKWAMDGIAMWRAEGLELPQKVKQATDEYRADMDILSSFIDECISLKYGSRVKAGTLYEVYTLWVDENNEYKMSNKNFTKEFTKKYPERVRLSDGIYVKDIEFTETAKTMIKKTYGATSSKFFKGIV